jgi:hypothetical protein
MQHNNDVISTKATAIYDHIELVVNLNLPIRSVDSVFYTRHVKPEPICGSILTNFMIKISNAVCQAIARELPDKFGIIIDGWTGEDHVYYVCIYAQYAIDGISKKPLLSICPQLSRTSHSHYETVAQTLKRYNKDTSNLIYMISSNCNTMTSLANCLKVPFIACASHKLDIAIRRYIGILNMGTDKQNKRASLVKIVHDMSVDLLRSNHKLASLRQIMGDSFVIPLIMKETRNC